MKFEVGKGDTRSKINDLESLKAALRDYLPHIDLAAQLVRNFASQLKKTKQRQQTDRIKQNLKMRYNI